MSCKYQECAKDILHTAIQDCREHPLLCSLFLMDTLLLMFYRYWMPFLLALALVGGLIYLSMFFGAKHASCFSRAACGNREDSSAG